MSSDFRIASNCLVNFVSRSHTMYLGQSGRPSKNMQRFLACCDIHAASGLGVIPAIWTLRVPGWMKNRTKYSTRPPTVQTFFEKKSQAHSVFAWILMNSSHVPGPRLGPSSKPFSSRMFRTVPLQIFWIPSFFSSPRIRPRPQAFSLAICTTSSRISWGFRGRPPLFSSAFLPTDLVSPLAQRVKVLGETMLISSLSFPPRGLPTFTSFSLSAGVTSTRRGSLLRKIRFSVLRYSTYRCGSGAVALANSRRRGWTSFFMAV